MTTKKSVAKVDAKVVRASKPAAKIVEKTVVARIVPKAGVRMLKKVQTAEGWKKENEKKNSGKKRKG